MALRHADDDWHELGVINLPRNILRALGGPFPALVTITFQGRAPDGTAYTLLAGAAITGAATTVYRIFPGATVTANVSAVYVPVCTRDGSVMRAWYSTPPRMVTPCISS